MFHLMSAGKDFEELLELEPNQEEQSSRLHEEKLEKHVHKHESAVNENRADSDKEKSQSNVHHNIPDNSKPHESLHLTEEMIKQMTLQSEQKVRKKLTHSVEEIFLTEKCLEKVRIELLKVLKDRYRTWKLENSTENRAAVLLHFTKIENELNQFERRIIQRYFENEEEEDPGKREKEGLNREEKWGKCDTILNYHRRNQKESIEEAKSVSEKFEEILKSDEEFTIKNQKLSTNLVLIMFLIFSAYNSKKELCVSEEQPQEEQFYAFEKKYPGVIDYIFSGFITSEMNQESLYFDSGNNQRLRLSIFHSQLVEILFNFCKR